jgi:hypothetical protein
MPRGQRNKLLTAIEPHFTGQFSYYCNLLECILLGVCLASEKIQVML